MIKKKEKGQGESKPDLSPPGPLSPPTTVDPVSAYFANPPDWLTTQLAKCHQEERFVKPTCATAAGEIWGTVTRWAEVEPVLRRHLSKGGRTS